LVADTLLEYMNIKQSQSIGKRF